MAKIPPLITTELIDDEENRYKVFGTDTFLGVHHHFGYIEPCGGSMLWFRVRLDMDIADCFGLRTLRAIADELEILNGDR